MLAGMIQFRRQAKIQQNNPALTVHGNVGGLDVAMQLPRRVQGLDTGGQLSEGIEKAIPFLA